MNVNKKMKKDIAKKILFSDPKNKLLCHLTVAGFYVSIASAIAFIITCIAYPKTVPNYWLSVFSNAALIAITGIFICIIAGKLLKQLVFKNLYERKNETIEMNETNLIYRYKDVHQPSSIIEVNIPKESLKNMNFDNKENKITLNGKILYTIIENNKQKDELRVNRALDTFIIYDYFEPSLYKALYELN